jgi:membrane protein
MAAARRCVTEFQEDALTDRAATLTYYSVLAIFPGLLFLVSLLGLLGQKATQPLIDNLAALVPGAVHDTIIHAVKNLQRGHATAGLLPSSGWRQRSGRRPVTPRRSESLGRHLRRAEGRPIWKTLPVRVGVTLVLMVLLVASALIVVLTGGLASRVGQVLGIGSTAVTVWDIAKWPVLLILVSLMLALLYWASPNAKQGFRWSAPADWWRDHMADRLCPVYSLCCELRALQQGLRHSGRRHRLLHLAVDLHVAVLIGAEFNAELERGRAIAGGTPADQEPFVELRDTGKLRRKARRKQTS